MRRKVTALTLLYLFAFAGTSYAAGHIALRSPAFANGQPIPAAYTCTGKDISPPLSWSGVPRGSRSLRLAMIDLTANFTHWKVSGIDPGDGDVAAGAVPQGGRQRKNSFGKVGYGGPCPPKGDSPHRYAFTITALDKGGKVLDRGSLTGTFARR
jgi:Raf kinase inhibitor-like YbhB/YbcL family protein